MGYCYLVTHEPTGRVYVGQTTATIVGRWANHVHGANRGDEYHLARAIAKYGPKAFTIQELSRHEAQEDLDNAERVAIIAFSAQDRKFGFNIREGGSRGRHSEEIKAKLREARLKQIVTPEMYEKGAAKRRGLKRSPEHAAKLSAAMKGKPKSEEARAKMSEAASRRIAAGNHPFVQGKRHTAGRIKGFHLSEEHKLAVSNARKNSCVPDSEVSAEILDRRERVRRYRARKKALLG
jgi:group I intron endonuclease